MRLGVKLSVDVNVRFVGEADVNEK